MRPSLQRSGAPLQSSHGTAIRDGSELVVVGRGARIRRGTQVGARGRRVPCDEDRGPDTDDLEDDQIVVGFCPSSKLRYHFYNVKISY